MRRGCPPAIAAALPSPASSSTGLVSRVSPHGGLLGLLVVFSAAVIPSLGDGIGSFDTYNTLHIVQSLIDRHFLIPSREPGHPGNLYLLGPVAWVLRHGFQRELGGTAYAILQWLLALGVATGFYAWLLRSGVSRLRATAGAACLVAAPNFLLQTLDGEEFLAALACLVAGILALGGGQATPPRPLRVAAAIFLFALMTTFRAEYVFAAAIFGAVHFLAWRVSWKFWLGAAFGTLAALVLLWLPILLTQGIHNPDPRMSLANAVLAWGYKLLFLCYGFPTSLVLFAAWFLGARGAFRAWRHDRVATPPALLASLAIVVAYLALYLTHPHKPGSVLVALPFFLFVLVRQHPALLGAATACTLVSVFAGVDIFRERAFTGPRLVPGGYRSARESKAAPQLPYLRAVTALPVTGKSVLIGDTWSWVIAFHLERGSLSAQSRPRAGYERGYILGGKPERLLIGREAAENLRVLDRFHREGYEIVIDRVLWRTLYARYDVSLRPGDRAQIGAVPVRLATVNAVSNP